MKLYFIYILVSVFFVFNENRCYSQSKTDLESKRNEYLKKIEYTNKLLNSNKKKQLSTTANLRLILNQIETRKLLIGNIEQEIYNLNLRIEDNEYVINSLENDLKRLKSEYEKLIYYAYKNHKKTNLWLFVFASESFNQAYRRYKYLVEYTRFRKKQKELIISIQTLIEGKNYDLNDERRKKQDLLFAYSKESDHLRNEIRSKERLIDNLKTKEKNLTKEIEVNKRKAEKIAEEIKKIIEREKRKKNIKSKEDLYITNEFRKNIGQIKWPVDEGIIINTYGEHFHPVLKEVKLNNPGIDISTSQNANVYCVFDGAVSGIYGILGTNNTVIVKHGSFFTVYQNVINLEVKIGTKLKSGYIIGKVFTDITTNSSVLHFEIWEDKKTVDPYLWISKNN